MDDFEIVRLIDDGVTWARMSEFGEGVVRVVANIKFGGETKTISMRPIRKEGAFQVPFQKTLFVPKGGGVTAEMSITLSDGRIIPWPNNGQPLVRADEGYEIAFDRSMYTFE